tara:strand:+ start:1572 stop:2453 length:882 start_codon:yes stop_codon:yes gene_type:complete
MIIDCFPFFNELDLLEIRLKLLDNIVDRVILVESTRTFSLRKKKLYYFENKDRFKKYNKKIIHIIVDETPALLDRIFLCKPRSIFWRIKHKKPLVLNAHHIDFYQKNKIVNGLTNCQDDDILILSDLDEIPNPEIFENISHLKSRRNALEIENFCYFLNGKLFDKNNNEPINELGPVIVEFKNFRSFHAERKEARNVYKKNNFNALNIIKRSGWHFGYLGGLKSIKQKLRSAAHTELNKKEINNKDNLINHINSGNFITEHDWKAKYKPLEQLFPTYICKIFYDYPHLIKKVT